MTLEDMSLSDASLAELVAELRERLRPFMAARPAAVASVDRSRSSLLHDEPGPLSPPGRAALAARLLALVLGQRPDSVSKEAAAAFDGLAEAFVAAPAPLPGSALESGLRRLAGEFEALAVAWDQGSDRELRGIWGSLRELGDSLWSTNQRRSDALGNDGSMSVAAATMESVRGLALWLLVSGRLRRDTLRRRLEAAGWPVECLRDGAQAAARLARERPAALICDDAAPVRHGTSLRRLLPAASPPVILVRCRVPEGGTGRDELVWLPPFRIADLPAVLGRCNP